jgi:CheY-like chemotaxis protein
MDGDPGGAVLVVRRQRSTSARTPPSRRSARPYAPETRFRRHDPLHAERASHGSAAGAGRTGGRRVLIVDDESSIRLICSINFTASGWEPLEATNGEEALELTRLEQPDVVLLDVMMPLLDGWKVAKRLAKDPATRDIPIVFLTARAEPRDRELAHRLGAVGYLTKPLDPVRLPDVMDEILRRLELGERKQLRAELLADA